MPSLIFPGLQPVSHQPGKSPGAERRFDGRQRILFGSSRIVAASPSVSEVLKTMPSRDRCALEDFFKEQFRVEPLGFVLLGTKPMCFDVLVPNSTLKKGWDAWKRYQRLLPAAGKFVVRETLHQYLIHPSTMKVKGSRLVIINKQNALKVIEKHWPVFHFVLSEAFPGRRLTPQELVTSLETDNPISNLMLAHHWLLGILLGFDNASSFMFHRKREIDISLHRPDMRAYALGPGRAPAFLSVEAEMSWLNEKLCGKSNTQKALDKYGSYKLGQVKFPFWSAALDYPEAGELLDRYAADYARVETFYAHPRFLENVLAILNGQKLEAVA